MKIEPINKTVQIDVDQILKCASQKLTQTDDFEFFLLAHGIVPTQHIELVEKQLLRADFKGKLSAKDLLTGHYDYLKTNICLIKYQEFKPVITISEEKRLRVNTQKLYLYCKDKNYFLLVHMKDLYKNEDVYALEIQNSLMSRGILEQYVRWVLEKQELSEILKFCDFFLQKIIKANSFDSLCNIFLEQTQSYYLISELSRVRHSIKAERLPMIIKEIRLEVLKSAEKIVNQLADQYRKKLMLRSKEVHNEIMKNKEIMDFKMEKIKDYLYEKFENQIEKTLSDYWFLKNDLFQNKILKMSNFDNLWSYLISTKKFLSMDVTSFWILKSYYQHDRFNALIKKIKLIFQKPIILVNPIDNSIIEISGNYIVLDGIFNKEYLFNALSLNEGKYKCIKCARIKALQAIYLSEDIIFSGKNIVLEAAKVECVKKITIDTSGADAKPYKKEKAENGQDFRRLEKSPSGIDGAPGKDGLPGEKGGDIYIEAKEDIVNIENLTLCSNGGAGANGQSGGDGDNGTVGEDGRDGNAKDKSSVLEFWCNVDLDKGNSGRLGGRGGNGGVAGRSGSGGEPGRVVVKVKNQEYRYLQVIRKRGKDGVPGKPGKGGEGGLGGRHGVDHGYQWTGYLVGKTVKSERGQLEKEKHSSWLRGTYYSLKKIKMEEEVKNTRSNKGEMGKLGQSIRVDQEYEGEEKELKSKNRDQLKLLNISVAKKLKFSLKDQEEEEKKSLQYQFEELTKKNIALEKEYKEITRHMVDMDKVLEKISELTQDSMSQMVVQAEGKESQTTILSNFKDTFRASRPFILSREKYLHEMSEDKDEGKNSNYSTSRQFFDKFSKIKDFEKLKTILLSNAFLQANKSIALLVEYQLEYLERDFYTDEFVIGYAKSLMIMCDLLKNSKLSFLEGRYIIGNIVNDIEIAINLQKNKLLEKEIYDLFFEHESKESLPIPIRFRIHFYHWNEIEKIDQKLIKMEEKNKDAVIKKIQALNKDKMIQKCVDFTLCKIFNGQKDILVKDQEDTAQRILSVLNTIEQDVISIPSSDEKTISTISCYKQFQIFIEKNINLVREIEYDDDLKFLFLCSLVFPSLKKISQVKIVINLKLIIKDKNYFIKNIQEIHEKIKKLKIESSKLFQLELQKILFLVSKMPLKLSEMDFLLADVDRCEIFDNSIYVQWRGDLIKIVNKKFEIQFLNDKLEEIQNKVDELCQHETMEELIPWFNQIFDILSSCRLKISYQSHIKYCDHLLVLLNSKLDDTCQVKNELKHDLMDLCKSSKTASFETKGYPDSIRYWAEKFNLSHQSQDLCGIFRELSNQKKSNWIFRKEHKEELYHYLKTLKLWLMHTPFTLKEIEEIYVNVLQLNYQLYPLGLIDEIVKICQFCLYDYINDHIQNKKNAIKDCYQKWQNKITDCLLRINKIVQSCEDILNPDELINTVKIHFSKLFHYLCVQGINFGVDNILDHIYDSVKEEKRIVRISLKQHIINIENEIVDLINKKIADTFIKDMDFKGYGNMQLYDCQRKFIDKPEFNSLVKLFLQFVDTSPSQPKWVENLKILHRLVQFICIYFNDKINIGDANVLMKKLQKLNSESSSANTIWIVNDIYKYIQLNLEGSSSAILIFQKEMRLIWSDQLDKKIIEFSSLMFKLASHFLNKEFQVRKILASKKHESIIGFDYVFSLFDQWFGQLEIFSLHDIEVNINLALQNRYEKILLGSTSLKNIRMSQITYENILSQLNYFYQITSPKILALSGKEIFSAIFLLVDNVSIQINNCTNILHVQIIFFRAMEIYDHIKKHKIIFPEWIDRLITNYQISFIHSFEESNLGNRQIYFFKRLIDDAIKIINSVSFFELCPYRRVEQKYLNLYKMTQIINKFGIDNLDELQKEIELLIGGILHYYLDSMKFRSNQKLMSQKLVDIVKIFEKRWVPTPDEVNNIKKIFFLIQFIQLNANEICQLLDSFLSVYEKMAIQTTSVTELTVDNDEILKLTKSCWNFLVRDIINFYSHVLNDNEKLVLHRLSSLLSTSRPFVKLLRQMEHWSLNTTHNRIVMNWTKDVQKITMDEIRMLLSFEEVTQLNYLLLVNKNSGLLSEIVHVLEIINPVNWQHYIQDIYSLRFFRIFLDVLLLRMRV